MKNLFPTLPGGRRLRQVALALGLLAGPASAVAQTAPATIYALGTVTQNYYFPPANPTPVFVAGQQLLTPLYPANLASGQLYGTGVVITGVAANQKLIAIDARPSTGQLYGLGFNATTNQAQLYTIETSTAVATPVSATLIPLDPQDNNRLNTRGLIPNIGFDFNPRVDRIRVVTPGGANLRLNPNTGGLAATDGNLAYVAGNTVGHTPYIGTVAYTNSALGVAGTTLYDIDVTNTNGLLSMQGSPTNSPNNGVLYPVNPVTFQTNTNPTFFPLTSPTIGLDLDIFYDRTSNSNLAYLVEARYTNGGGSGADINNGGTTNQFSSNLWAFNLTTGQASGRNIFGQVPVFLSNIAAMINMPKTWTGANGTNWGQANNWFPVGIPTATDDVVIPGNGTFVSAANVTVANQPIVSDAEQAASVNLINNALLTTANGGTLSVNGDFVNNDSQVAGSGTGTVALVGTTQDVGGNVATTFQNLTVNATGATTSAAVSVVRALTVSGNLAIGAGTAFTLLSNAGGTAFVVNQGTGSVTGSAIVQRYITPTNNGLGYRHYSSPVSGNVVADFTATGYSPVVNPAYNSSATPPNVSPFPNIYTYDQSRLGLANSSPEFDKGYLSPGSVNDPIATATGYVVNINASALVDFAGTLNTGNYSRSNLARGPQASAGWQLLGNPYPGAINYDVVRAASTGLEGALYVVKSTGQYSGTYSSYVNGAGNNTGTSNIPLGQGFFVRTAAGQTASVNFTNAARTNAPETGLFQRTTADLRPALAFTVRNAAIANQTRVYFEQGATSAFDAQYDAHYLPATHGLDLATDISTEVLSINGLPELTTTTTVPLYLHAATAGTYTLAVDELNNLPAGYHAYLRDARTGSYTDLATTPSLSLTLAPADAPTGRFTVVFATSQLLATAPAALASLVALYPNPAHGGATLLLPQALRGNATSQVEVLNTLGQVALRRTVAANSPEAVELPLGTLAPGIYTVRATTASGSVAKQLRVE